MTDLTDPEVRTLADDLADDLADECRARATYSAGGVGGAHRWRRAGGRGSLTPP